MVGRFSRARPPERNMAQPANHKSHVGISTSKYQPAYLKRVTIAFGASLTVPLKWHL